ncbi:hypothetical protein MVEN_02361900 [Mycena venus]|uniref:Homeobox domain-containing protein n=1 Tax=Mycena venus TaxID=2733690 RepID=A0A8H6X354_9AGAR|nr:hypothetical protein MVEN_02361900 [Mycena venus]
MHSNILPIEGVSSPTALNDFIVCESVYWKAAEGPLAAALKNDLTRSITLGFKLVAGLSSGMDHLTTQGISLASLGAENFDIFLDIDDRFLISINLRMSIEPDGEPEGNTSRSWDVLNALCQMVLRSANRALYNENIERDPVALELSHRPSAPQPTPAPSSLIPPPFPEPLSAEIISEEPGPFPPWREYICRTIDRGRQSLASVASQIALDLDLKLASSVKITLATTTVHSAVISHDAPSPLEICSICHEVVGFHEQFRCLCGDPAPGPRPTVKCQACKYWSHGNCVGNPREFTCQHCSIGPNVAELLNMPSISTANALSTDPTQSAESARPALPRFFDTKSERHLSHVFGSDLAQTERSPRPPSRNDEPGVTGLFDYHFFYPYTPNEVNLRRHTTGAQLKVLEGVFKRDTKPNAALRAELASQLNMTARGVQVWFQNRRAKAKASQAALQSGHTNDVDFPPSRSPEDSSNQVFETQDFSLYWRGSLPARQLPPYPLDPLARRRSVDASLARLASDPYARKARAKNYALRRFLISGPAFTTLPSPQQRRSVAEIGLARLGTQTRSGRLY